MSQRDTSSIRNLLIGIVVFIGIILPIASIINKLVTAEFELHNSQASNTEQKTEQKDVDKVVLISEPKSEAKITLPTISNEDLIIVNKLGKEVYDKACTSCHTVGLAGAPKFGDKNSWIDRIAKGEDTLISNAMNGINIMPPRGGRSELSDEEMKAAVQYMLLAINDVIPDVVQTTVKPVIEPIKIAEKPEVTEPVVKSIPKPIIEPTLPVTDKLKSGKEVYAMSCITCHGEGVVGSPKIGDKISWQPRINKGEDALISSVINGLNIMPPRGGNSSLSDGEIKQAVEYMMKAVANPTPSQIEKPSKTVKQVMPGNAKMSGKEVYDTSCASCHIVGIAKAPIFGNKDDWKPRIAKGEPALISNVINGFNVMPPRGGNNHLNDAEIKLAVQYMIKSASGR